MSRPRPFMQRGISDLEALFAGAIADSRILKQLEGELRHRQVPRAVSLLAEVQAALRGGSKAEVKVDILLPLSTAPPVPSYSPVTPPRQPEPRSLSGSTRAAAGSTAPSVETAGIRGIEPPNQALIGLKPAPPLLAEAAYLLLNSTRSTPWVLIEKVRRQLVDGAHPSRLAAMTCEQQERAREIARSANAAYAVLLASRTATA